jgi:hypothetical protein
VADNSDLDKDMKEDAEGINEAIAVHQVSIQCRIPINAGVVMKWHFSVRPTKQ